MIYSKPQPFKQAVQASQLRSLLPTSLRTAEFEQLVADGHAAILERGRFSAGVRCAQRLDVIDSGINALVDGTTDLATQRLAVKNFNRATSYMAPQDEQGTLTDLGSDARINLQLTMGVQQAQGAGFLAQASQPDVADAFPALEFKRVESRVHPREDWKQRWNEARAATTADGATDADSGVMAAVIGHPIWKKLNRFGVDYEPFDFGSGYGLESMSRKRAMELGIIDRDTQVFPPRLILNEGLKVSPEIRSATLRSLLEQTGLGRFDAAGVFNFTGGGA